LTIRGARRYRPLVALASGGKDRARRVIAIVLGLQLLAVVLGEMSLGFFSRLLWPFNGASMFIVDSDELGVEHRSMRFQVVLIDGATETPIDWEFIHPHPYMGEWGMRYRMARIPRNWTEDFERGFARSAQRYRCEKKLRAEALGVYELVWTHEALISDGPPLSRTLFRRIPLPATCEGAP
jgi:hypothetical protein